MFSTFCGIGVVCAMSTLNVICHGILCISSTLGDLSKSCVCLLQVFNRVCMFVSVSLFGSCRFRWFHVSISVSNGRIRESIVDDCLSV